MNTEKLNNPEVETEFKKPREKKVFEFFGRVITKDKIKQTAGRFAGQFRYDLKVEIYDDPTIRVIQVMKDNVPEELWEAVLNSDYYSCNWIFFCHRLGEKHRLFKWNKDSKLENNDGDK